MSVLKTKTKKRHQAQTVRKKSENTAVHSVGRWSVVLMWLPLNNQWLDHHLAKGITPQLLWQSQSNHTLMKNMQPMCYSDCVCYRKWIGFWDPLKSGHNKRPFWSFWRGSTKLKYTYKGAFLTLEEEIRTALSWKVNWSTYCVTPLGCVILKCTLLYNILIAHRRAWTSLIAIYLLAYRLASGEAG